MEIRMLQQQYLETQEKLTQLSQQLETEQVQRFRTLPAELGLGSIDALIEALLPLSTRRLKTQLASIFTGAGHVHKNDQINKASASRKRIDPNTRVEIVSALKAGNIKVTEIAETHGVSVASVNLIKAKEGLTKARRR